MQCERLIKMTKSWYLHVRDETMAPARMVGFIEEHAQSCEICIKDPDLKEEIAKITELILPESKIPKAVRQQNLKAKEAEEEEVETVDDEDEDLDSKVDGEDEDHDSKVDDKEIEVDLEVDDS